MTAFGEASGPLERDRVSLNRNIKRLDEDENR
jgi:hypothetical protein